MARGKGKQVSKSALQLKEEADERRKKDIPLFSLEGIVVHKRKILALALGIMIAFGVLLAVVASVSAPSNLTVAASSTFSQARSGEPANFSLTVKNTAAFSAYAYEVHALLLPPGWSVLSGEDAFALKSGESRQIPFSVSTGADAPPNHDYPITVKVFAKSGDLARTLSSTSTTVTVRILSSALTLGFESRVTTGLFAANQSTAGFTFSACGASGAPLVIEAPSDANITSVGFSLNFNASGNPDATGYLTADVGADGSIESNSTMTGAPSRVTLGAGGFANYSLLHPAAPPTLTVPVALYACANATSWAITLTDALVNYQHPAAPLEPVLADATNVIAPDATAHFLARVVNDEPRPLTIVLGLRDTPTGWTTAPTLGTTPIPVPAHSSNTLDFTLHILKNAPQGNISLVFVACLQANPNDCATRPETVTMPAIRFFTVKSYVEPATLKVLYQGRSLDILLLAQNAGNTPTAFLIDLPLQPGLTATFRDASGNISGPTQVPLALNESRPLVLHLAADLGLTPSVYTVIPNFRNITAGQAPVQADLRFQVHVQPPPDPPRLAAIGSKLTVDFAGITQNGLLVDTNIFSILPLIDQHQRPTHPQYVRPAGAGVAPYEFTVKALADYQNVEHKGFEPFIVGALEQETLVFWLTPDQTKLNPNAFLFGETLVFEVKVTTIVAP
jgi:hypothetical protein